MRLSMLRTIEAVRPFIPKMQLLTMTAGLRGEERAFFREAFRGLEATIAAMPVTYEQSELGDQAVVHLHYFMGGADWWITEKDKDGGTPQAFGLVAIAAAVQDIRYYLKGVLLDFDAGALVGTDGARLHCHRGGVPVVEGAGQVTVPVDAVKWLLHSADEVAQVTVWRMANGHAQVLLRTSDAFVFAHGLEGRYPEWQRVVPALGTCGARFRVDPSALAAAVESMGKLHRLESGGKRGVVSLDVVAGRVHAGGGDSFHAVDVTADTGHGEAFPLYLTADYLQDAADCVGVGARWALPQPGKAGAAGPLLVTDGPFAAVVMPHRPPQQTEKPEGQAAPVEPPADPAPEDAPEAEPCPAAVAAVAAQLVGRAMVGPECPKKARKGRASRKAEPVEA